MTRADVVAWVRAAAEVLERDGEHETVLRLTANQMQAIATELHALADEADRAARWQVQQQARANAEARLARARAEETRR